MTDFLFILFSSLLLIWSLSNLDENHWSPLFIFSSFFSAMLPGICAVRILVRVIEWLQFESERNNALICSNRTQHREWSRPSKTLKYSVGLVPVGKLRPGAFNTLPKTVLF